MTEDRLDRAIAAGRTAAKWWSPVSTADDRTFARALIADLISDIGNENSDAYGDILNNAFGMFSDCMRSRRAVCHQGPKPQEAIEHWVVVSVLSEIRSRAGIGGE